MRVRNQSSWEHLVIERRVTPPALTDDQFRNWLAANPIFVSSTMDDEMTPARETVRALLHRLGGTPIMWEELAPRDQQPETAYLDGVDRSRLFVLMLGHRYGRADDSGYSPTHKEANRAATLHITRLLFQPNGLRASERDGRLNDWIASLHSQISGNSYSGQEDLSRALQRQLREIASAQETPWIKLGPVIFPGKVQRQIVPGETRFVITARVSDRGVREAIADLSNWRGVNADRLTWGFGTWAITSLETEINTPTLSADEVRITCKVDPQRSNSGNSGFGRMNYIENGKTFGPREQSMMWAERALFSNAEDIANESGVRGWARPDGIILPEVLRRENARGWLAEGLVRLYLIEELIKKFGGQINDPEVGPSSATGVRVEAGFSVGDDQPLVKIHGIVPFLT